MTRSFIALLAIGIASGCSTGPDFPPLPAEMLAAYCVRGEAQIHQTKIGSITSGDCNVGFSFREVWRVRVASPTSVTFDANSSFDNYLEVFRLDSYTATSARLTWIGSNGDRWPGNLNALVTVTLQPNTDYFVRISGLDYADTGPYSLAIAACAGDPQPVSC